MFKEVEFKYIFKPWLSVGFNVGNEVKREVKDDFWTCGLRKCEWKERMGAKQVVVLVGR